MVADLLTRVAGVDASPIRVAYFHRLDMDLQVIYLMFDLPVCDLPTSLNISHIYPNKVEGISFSNLEKKFRRKLWKIPSYT